MAFNQYSTRDYFPTVGLYPYAAQGLRALLSFRSPASFTWFAVRQAFSTMFGVGAGTSSLGLIAVAYTYMNRAVVRFGANVVQNTFTGVGGAAVTGMRFIGVSRPLAVGLQAIDFLSSVGDLIALLKFVLNPENTAGHSISGAVTSALRFIINTADKLLLTIPRLLLANPTTGGIFVIVVALGLTLAYLKVYKGYTLEDANKKARKAWDGSKQLIRHVRGIEDQQEAGDATAVSYTHLTLPTILLV